MHQTVMKYQEGEFMKRGKSMAMLLSAAMLVTTLSPLTAEAAEGLTNQVLDLSFDNSLKDSAGAHGVTMGKGTENYAEGIKGQGLSLDGKSYVKLGTEEDLQPENLTLSFWMKPNKDMGNGEQLITWNKNEYFTDGWYLSMENGNRPLTLSVGPAANNGQPYRVSVDGNRAEFFPVGEWTHVAVTYDKETKDIRFYRNGKECATSITYGINETSTGVLGSDASMEKSIGYNGPKYNGWGMYIAGEYGGMNESLARLYEITHEDRYQEAAELFDHKTWFADLAANKDVVQDKHANQHIPRIVGAVHEYAATGDVSYYNTAQNFWDIVTQRYAYSIGGVGTGEKFQKPYQQGNYILGNAGRGENCETCAAYNMLKLTKDLYNYNPDNAEYMDYYERTMLNQIAASQSHDTTDYMHNGTTYMLPIDPGQKRGYDTDYGGFTCCNGTGMENHVKYQAAAYAKSADTLYVNQYMPTTVNWEEKGISVKQETKFPSEHSKLTVKGSGKFTMKLRVPYWATEGFEVKVNGETICTNPEVSTYVEINRTWKDGDVVEIHMPYTLHLDKTPDKVDGSTVASIMYGPMVMVAKDERDSYTPMNWYTVALSDNLEDSISVVTGADSEQVPHLTTNGLQFYPMYDAYNYRYHAYVKVEENTSVVNKDELQALVDAVTTGDRIPSKDDYTEEQWETLQQAIKDAQAVLKDPDATQTDVYNAYKALQAALEDTAENPEPEKPDKEDLQNAVDHAIPDSEKDQYTKDTWDAYQQALDHAKDVLKDENATEEDIANALNELNKAKDALKKADDTQKPGTGGDGQQGNGGNDGKPGAGNSGAGNDGQTGGSGSAAGTVKTGDSANIMLWVLLLGASVLGCFTVLRRQRRQK